VLGKQGRRRAPLIAGSVFENPVVKIEPVDIEMRSGLHKAHSPEKKRGSHLGCPTGSRRVVVPILCHIIEITSTPSRLRAHPRNDFGVVQHRGQPSCFRHMILEAFPYSRAGNRIAVPSLCGGLAEREPVRRGHGPVLPPDSMENGKRMVGKTGACPQGIPLEVCGRWAMLL
jgi:hypothetical protein